MANVSVPSIATATPADGDTVVGVQNGAVKRFPVADLLLSARLPAANTIALIGDSIIGRNYSAPFASQAWFEATGYWTWANILLGQRFTVVNEAGVTGETSTQIQARFAAAVLARSPSWVAIMAGSNDAAGGVAYATTISNLQSMYEAARAAGIRVIAFTVLPRSDINTASERENLHRVNGWVRNYARKNPGIVLIDSYALWADPATNAPVSGLTSDGIHPTCEGASLIGRAINTTIGAHLPLMPAANLLNNDVANLVYNGSVHGNNPAGTNGWSPGTGITGNGPNGWQAARTGTITAVASKAARAVTDLRKGDWAQLAVTGGGATGTVYYNLRYDKATWSASATLPLGVSRYPTVPNGRRYVCTTAGTTGASQPTWPTTPSDTVADGTIVWTCVDDFVPGDRVIARCEFEADSFTGGGLADLEIVCLSDGFATLLTVRAIQFASPLPTYVPASGVLQTPPFLLPATTTRIHVRPTVRAEAGVTGNVRFSAVELVKTDDPLLV